MGPQPTAAVLTRENALQALDSLDKSALTSLEDVTDRVRKLSFAGIAIVWLFRRDTGSAISVDPLLTWALAGLVAALVLDFLQSTFTAAGWWFEIKSLRGKQTFDVSKPASWIMEEIHLPHRISRGPRTTWPLLFTKCMAVGLAYILIGWYIGARLIRG